jgi:hypothetical protein
VDTLINSLLVDGISERLCFTLRGDNRNALAQGFRATSRTNGFRLLARGDVLGSISTFDRMNRIYPPGFSYSLSLVTLTKAQGG